MKFSIRDLIFVTVIVAILAAWWVDHRRQAVEIERLSPVQDLIWQNILSTPSGPIDLTPTK
ncbi:MAG: hypothetical protein ACKVP0_11215 [Pirellulaceae bacterium]